MLDGKNKLGIHLIKEKGEQNPNEGIPEWISQQERSLPVTKVIDIAPGSSVDLPVRFTRVLQEEGADFVLMILTPRCKMIRLLLMRSREAVKVTLEINELSIGFLKYIDAISVNYEIHRLYSTGVCFSDGCCIYESYYDKSEFTLTALERFLTELNNIPGVSSTNYTILKVE